MGMEDQVEEALEGGVRYHLEGLDFSVGLALVLGGLDFRVALALILGALDFSVALALVGDLDSVAFSDPASIISAAAACSRTVVALYSDTQAQMVHHPLYDSLPSWDLIYGEKLFLG
ncbi:hypothetical protein CFC21_112281 [Triticum aestivum]|uniref:Uncharacterized protein n=2 Tax=Triticum aestivum TaxID=4565 RepID=A0A9R0G4G8_WHEAT|nr:uncharacterized protein LOC119282217 [Triticum dicoccoides]XP_044445353.1 uncharacterized protein LOC123172455 [Triticum aestivum]MBC2899441.1 hypothetical protein [Triticum aestivum]CDM86279.1 unnamed protein product [Triticum aestivum]